MDISYTSRTEKLLNTNTEGKKLANHQKEVQVKLMKGLLDLIVLQFLSSQPMHGYQIITKIRKSFGVYFGPSTIYPLLATLEQKGYVNSEWNMAAERPRKIYKLTNEGHNLLNFTENSLNFICRKISAPTNSDITVEASNQAALKPIVKKIRAQESII
jgi:PadR family transcriptional regulator PadR